MQWDWAYAGVNASVPRNAGPECANYLTTRRHWVECVLVVIGCMFALQWAIGRAKPVPAIVAGSTTVAAPMTTGKKVLLICMTFTLGLELGFKLSSRSVIYILNPCHITTIVQIYLLVAKPSKLTTALFRVHLNFLNGPLLAYVFPEIESRQVVLERPTYYIQHGLMFIIPAFMLKEGGAYNVEDLTDVNWNVIGYSVTLLYHFVLLEVFAIPSQVNLNHMLCPAILDPFQGDNYRLWAVVHQAILCPALSKVYCILFKPRTVALLKPTLTNNSHTIAATAADLFTEPKYRPIQSPPTHQQSDDNTKCDNHTQSNAIKHLVENNINNKKVE